MEVLWECEVNGTFPQVVMDGYTEVNVKAIFKTIQTNMKNGCNLLNDEINNLQHYCKTGLNEIDIYCKHIVDTLIDVLGARRYVSAIYTYNPHNSVYLIQFDVQKQMPGLKNNVKIIAGEKFGSKAFFTDVVNSVSAWLTEYYTYISVAPAISMLNSHIDRILLNNQICFTVQWDIGSDLIAIDDNRICFGVKLPNLINLLAVFRQIYTNQSMLDDFVDTLKMCVNPIDLLLVDNNITRKLGIYKRTSLYTRITNVYPKPLAKVHTGVGFVKNSNYFAVVGVASLDSNSAKYLPDSLYYITDNKKPTKTEVAADKNKLAYTYIIKPIGAYNMPYKASLREVVEM